MYFYVQRPKKATVDQLIDIGYILVEYFLYFNASKTFTESNTDLTALISLAIPVFLVLAAVGIYKDEQLVKNADRLR
jgi:hypothetical protein